MAEKAAKKKKGKGDANVLGSLPTTRPNRLGRRTRDQAPAATARATPKAKPAARPKAAAKASAKPKTKPRAVPQATVSKATPARPKPVRSASENLAEPALKSAGKRAPAPTDKTPSGTELVSTVVQAAGELASVGLSIGGQIVKRAVERLPKP